MVPNVPGPFELVILLVIVLLVVGPKRLPQMARSLGSGARELKDSFTSKSDADDTPEHDVKAEKAKAPTALGQSETLPSDAQVVQGETVPERR